MTVIAFLVDKYFENHLVFVEQKCRQPLPAVLRGGVGGVYVCVCVHVGMFVTHWCHFSKMHNLIFMAAEYSVVGMEIPQFIQLVLCYGTF